jgi:hypothetical protein
MDLVTLTIVCMFFHAKFIANYQSRSMPPGLSRCELLLPACFLQLPEPSNPLLDLLKQLLSQELFPCRRLQVLLLQMNKYRTTW